MKLYLLTSAEARKKFMSDVIRLNIKSKTLKAFVPGHGVDMSQFSAFSQEDSLKKEMERKYQTGFDEGYQKAKDDLENEYSEELLKKTEESCKL